ncbi:MAG: hypothetical protein K8R54_19940 [Bacteroidales bacterium]|nr:hypothetical protein [Bacteroidales bacterium]
MIFDFINDEKFRNILERDFEELNKCIESKSSKSVLILSGSIIEAVLTEYFINFPIDGLTKKKILEKDLYSLIELAFEQKFISQSAKDLSTVIKNYRNLIHPGREIRKRETFDFDTAIVAKSLLNIILKEIKENYLNNIGYSALDLIIKLDNDALSQPIFEKLLNKIHKSEKSKLYNLLVENELDYTQYLHQIETPKKYLAILKSQIDREVIENQLKKIIYKIETGEKWEVITYYNLLYEDINYLEDDDIELILLYILNAFSELSSKPDSIKIYVDQKLFSTFGIYLNTESIKKEFLKLVCSLVSNIQSKEYVYHKAYDQLINSVSTGNKEIIKEHVKNNVNLYYYDLFYKGYDNYLLPF